VINPTNIIAAMKLVTGIKLGIITQVELKSGRRAIADIVFGSSIAIAFSFLK
jgi:hypothetical protein